MQLRLRTEFTMILAGVIVMLASGCSKSPGQLHQDALQGARLAREARADSDARKARRAADSAMSAVSQLRKLNKPDAPADEEFRRRLGEAETAAREARNDADIAEEEKEHREAIGSIASKLYHNARPVVLGTLFKQLASATAAAGKLQTNDAPAVSAAVAKQAWELVCLVGAAEPLADGSPDWDAATMQLSIWSTNQPMELRAFLSLAFMSVGQPAVALAEFEMIDPSTLTETNDLRFYRMGRTLLYTQQGWNHLAAQEAALFSKCNTTKEANEAGRFMIAGLHAFMAYEAGKEREFGKMDAEIAQVVRVWPENPMVTYLTGEKLATNGEWERAAESLEASAKGTKDEWMAKQLAERARELRDGRGSTKTFVLDAGFLIPFIARGVAAQAENSEAGKKLSGAVEQAKNFGAELTESLRVSVRQKAAADPEKR